MSGVDTLNCAIPVSDDIQILMATAPAKKVCALVALLNRSERVEPFLPKFKFKCLFDEFGACFR